MEYQKFISVIRDLVAEKMGPGYEVLTKKILKYNSVELESLLIRKGNDQIMPTIYLESFYKDEEEGKTTEEVADSIIDLYEKCIADMDVNVNIDFSGEAVRKNVVFRLMNYEKNRELLKDSIYIRVNDLAAVYYYCVVGDGETLSSIRLTERSLETFGIEKDELYGLAKENTVRLFPSTMNNIKDVMKDIYQRNMLNGSCKCENEEEIKSLLESEDRMEMYVLSNTKGINGATCLLYDGLLDSIRRELDCDFYILPCSVHEVILLPARDEDETEYLANMVKSVNRTNVGPQDFLSDSVYRYSKDSFAI